MRKGNRKSSESLTEDEVQFLRSEKCPPTIRQFVSRQHESVGVRTAAYRKIAAAARAERDALLEVAALEVTRAAAEGSLVAQGRVSALEAEQRRLQADLDETRRKLLAATAAPALAVHSNGTSR